MKKLFTTILFLAAVQLWSVAQPVVLTEGAPGLVGMSDKKLALIDQFVTDYINKGYIPGGVFLVARDNQIVYYKNFGFRSTDKKAPYQKDDIFRIASMTKAVTTVSVMQLYEQGKIGLDDPVYKYIPAFKNSVVLDQFNPADSSYTSVPAKSPITIRQLLTHTSGIVYGTFSQGPLQAIYTRKGLMDVGLSHPTMTTEEFINRLATVPLAFQPGERFTYGLNMDVLGRLIEVVSGQKLSDYFRKNIFEPLGMKSTFFYLPKEKQAKLVPIYAQREDGTLEMAASEGGVTSVLDYPLQADHDHYAGGGGLSSTAMDYAIFIQALLQNGEYNSKRILGRKTIEMMTGDQLIRLNQLGTGYSNRPGETYCLGFSLITEQGKGISVKSPGTYEWSGYFNTKYFIDPKEQIIFVGMTQILGSSHGELWDRLAALIYSALQD